MISNFGVMVKSAHSTLLALLIGLAFCSCEKSENYTTHLADPPAEITHSIVVKFWGKEVYTQTKPVLPKVMVDVFDELCSIHVEEDTKFLEIELIYRIKKGDEALYDSYRVFYYKNPRPGFSHMRLGIADNPDTDIPIEPVRSFESAMNIMHECCKVLFEEWWQNRNIGE